jgi:hypothetical protein
LSSLFMKRTYFLVVILVMAAVMTACTQAPEVKTNPALTPILTALDEATEVVISQSDEPGMKKVLDSKQLEVLKDLVSKLKYYDMGSPHGSGYPGYVVTVYKGTDESVVFEIQDPVYVLADTGGLYFEGDGQLWQAAKEWLPVKATKPGMTEELFKAGKVEIMDIHGNQIVYDLKSEPYLAFRIATIVRILKSAETEPGFDPAGSTPFFTITFFIDDRTDVLKIYDNHAYCAGLVYSLENIGQIVGTNINAG